MTNDTTTLNGALQELGETMASNLVTKGVQASASDGLTTLAGKILDIQTGGSCYHIEFSEASYTADSGSATVTIYLQANYEPLPNATITLSDGSSQYSCITNSNGVATYSFSNVSSDLTVTASYSNVTASCTITVGSTVYFYDDASIDNTALYDTTSDWSGATLTYHSDGYYIMKMTSTAIKNIWISGLSVPNNVKITCDMKITTTTNTQSGIVVMNSSKNKGIAPIYEYQGGRSGYAFSTLTTTQTHGTKIKSDTYLSQSQINNWVTLELIINGSAITYNLYDSSSNVLATYSTTYSDLDSSNNIVGLVHSYNNNMVTQFKNLKVESL